MPFAVKNTTLPGLLDLLAPHYCRGCGRLGEPLCSCCKNYIIQANLSDFCPNCKQNRLTKYKPKNTNNAQTFLKYHKNKYLPHFCPHCQFPLTYIVGHRTNLLDTLIRDYKYDSIRAISPKLAELLHVTIPKLPKDTIIIPLPTIAKHIRARGIDHTYLVAKYLSKLRNYKIQKLLLRSKNTIQVGSTRKERIRQAPFAYQINPKINIIPTATYLLLDDVWTTGASMKSAIEQLHQAGIKLKHIRIAILAISD